MNGRRALFAFLSVLAGRNQPGHPGGFNKTHPAPAKRIANAEKSAGQYRVPDTRSYRQARYERLK